LIILAVPALTALFIVSPLPISLGLVTDPGYGDSLWLPVLLVFCIVFVVSAIAGVAVGMLVEHIAKRRRGDAINIP